VLHRHAVKTNVNTKTPQTNQKSQKKTTKEHGTKTMHLWKKQPRAKNTKQKQSNRVATHVLTEPRSNFWPMAGLVHSEY
jgi:hypothetical protein